MAARGHRAAAARRTRAQRAPLAGRAGRGRVRARRRTGAARRTRRPAPDRRPRRRAADAPGPAGWIRAAHRSTGAPRSTGAARAAAAERSRGTHRTAPRRTVRRTGPHVAGGDRAAGDRGLRPGAGTAPDRLAPDAAFADLGVDSLVALELTKALEADHGSLPATLLFERTTIRRLADHLHSRAGGPAAAAPEPAAPVPARPAPAEAAVAPPRAAHPAAPAPAAAPPPAPPTPSAARTGPPPAPRPAAPAAAPAPVEGPLRAAVDRLSDAEVDRMLTLLGALATTTDEKGDTA
ncbi:acyl carrier protein [Streptomyces sp. AA1529]|uniref:acyl carrier protein n=1 Tax=Streptomyces sp. AA1529 TaxID=1203257 RepID=UPI003FD3F8EA